MNLDVSSHLHRHTVVKDQRPLPLIPRAARHGFERTGRTHRVAADVAPLNSATRLNTTVGREFRLIEGQYEANTPV